MAKNSRNWPLIIGVVAVILVVLAIVMNYWFAPMIFEQNRQAGEDIAKESIDRESAIRNYRWFRNQWFEIKSMRDQLENQKSNHQTFHQTYGNDSEEWPRDARIRHGRIHQRITGTRNMIDDLIAEYKARRSDATRAIFTCGLPYNIDEKLFIADASGVEYTSKEAKMKTPPEDPSECKFAQSPEE